ncbi:MAG: DUF302 domain-containing protein [Nitrospira sp.]|nr:DUF302 domain-containing protein [Nitrospira sp.]
MNVLTPIDDTNLITKMSRYSVIETIDRIEKAIAAMGMHIFARIDHGGEAKKAGLEMTPTMRLIFGNPKMGTTLMIARPTVAIDLPLKALHGKTLMARSRVIIFHSACSTCARTLCCENRLVWHTSKNG